MIFNLVLVALLTFSAANVAGDVYYEDVWEFLAARDITLTTDPYVTEPRIYKWMPEVRVTGETFMELVTIHEPSWVYTYKPLCPSANYGEFRVIINGTCYTVRTRLKDWVPPTESCSTRDWSLGFDFPELWLVTFFLVGFVISAVGLAHSLLGLKKATGTRIISREGISSV